MTSSKPTPGDSQVHYTRPLLASRATGASSPAFPPGAAQRNSGRSRRKRVGREGTPPAARGGGGGVGWERAMVSLLKVLVYGVGGMAVAGVALLAAFQEKLIYVPVLPGLSKSYPFTPARLRLNYEDVWLRASDGVRLHSWFIKHHPERAGPTILFFQENAGNIAHRLEYIRIMLQRLECNVFMLSYRGYGASDGCPSQHGITKDAQAALDHLLQRSDIDPSRIVVFGRSLGGAVGSVLVRNNPDKVSALILENTFTSILDMAGVMLPILKWFIGGSGSNGPKILNFLVRSPWSTIDIIGQIKPPILFLSGLQDELVPPSHMQMLYERAVENNRLCLFIDFPTGMHMDTWLAGGDRYWRTIQLFLNQYVPGKEESVMQCAGDNYDEIDDDNDDDYDYDDDDDNDDDTEAG